MSSSGSANIGKQAQTLDISQKLGRYSKVTINVTDELFYSAGDDTGRELTIDCPWGTQEMAENILRDLEGYQYQPFTATGTRLDLAAELGDGITVNGVYGGLFSQTETLSAEEASDIAAPFDEEVEHEYAYESSSERKINRKIANVESELVIQADRIEGKVSRSDYDEDMSSISSQLLQQANAISAKVSSSGGSASSFGWQLTSDGFILASNNRNVLVCNSDGISITGAVTATSGKIGNFTIGSGIYNGISQFGGSQTTGVYIGTDGIQLGQGFKVSSSGHLEATSGTFGSISVNSSGNTVGTYSGNLGGCGGSFKGSLGGCGGSLGTGIKVGDKTLATYVGDIIADTITATFIKSRIANMETMSIGTLSVRSKLEVQSGAGLTLKGKGCAWKSQTVVTSVTHTNHERNGYVTGITVKSKSITYLGQSGKD